LQTGTASAAAAAALAESPEKAKKKVRPKKASLSVKCILCGKKGGALTPGASHMKSGPLEKLVQRAELWGGACVKCNHDLPHCKAVGDRLRQDTAAHNSSRAHAHSNVTGSCPGRTKFLLERSKPNPCICDDLAAAAAPPEEEEEDDDEPLRPSLRSEAPAPQAVRDHSCRLCTTKASNSRTGPCQELTTAGAMSSFATAVRRHAASSTSAWFGKCAKLKSDLDLHESCNDIANLRGKEVFAHRECSRRVQRTTGLAVGVAQPLLQLAAALACHGQQRGFERSCRASQRSHGFAWHPELPKNSAGAPPRAGKATGICDCA